MSNKNKTLIPMEISWVISNEFLKIEGKFSLPDTSNISVDAIEEELNAIVSDFVKKTEEATKKLASSRKEIDKIKVKAKKGK